MSHSKARVKTAVLIADAYGYPFEQLRHESNKIWHDLQMMGVDIYYCIGTRENWFQKLIGHVTEKLRFSKFAIAQRIWSRFFLSRYNRQLPLVALCENQIRVDVPEGLQFLGVKIFCSLRILFQSGYQVVYKTTLSSVVNSDLFIRCVNSIDREMSFYGGTKISTKKLQFVSGANLFINKKTFNIIENHFFEWDQGVLDDVAIGRILQNRVEITEIASINLGKIEDVHSLSSSNLAVIQHFRCKSNQEPRRDLAIIEELLIRLKSKNESSRWK